LTFVLAGSDRAAAKPETPADRLVFQADITPPSGQGPWVVRAYYTDRNQVIRLAERIEPWEVNNLEGYILLDVDPAQYQWLLDLGFRVEIDEALTTELTRPRLSLPGQVNGIPGYPCYRTVEETFTTAVQIVIDYPNLATWIDIGDSWKRTVFGEDSGYDMLVLRITNDQYTFPKPKLFILSSIHAREYAPAELNTRFAEYLVSNYGTDPDVTWLLDYHEIHLLLQANPDGRERAEEGVSWRKNTNNNYCSDTPTRGADLNRNFDFRWGCCGGSSGNQCDQTFRGSNPSSEPETQAIQNYVRSNFPDQREDSLNSPAPEDATGIFIDLHSYGELVLWPWGFTSDPPPNASGLRTLGRKFSYFNEYTPEQSIYLYPTDGTTDDFAYGELGLAAYTIELGTSFFQNCPVFENQIYPDNLSALLYAAKAVRTPYLTPAGPDTLPVNLSPSIVFQGIPTQVTARITDERYTGGEATQNISAAEYYIDSPPWITKTVPIAFSMTPVDGAFDEKIEDVTASIDTTGLQHGKHIVFVRGQDAEGNWGIFSAAFLTVNIPQFYLPLLSK
jgi:hypothetical protein